MVASPGQDRPDRQKQLLAGLAAAGGWLVIVIGLSLWMDTHSPQAKAESETKQVDKREECITKVCPQNRGNDDRDYYFAFNQSPEDLERYKQQREKATQLLSATGCQAYCNITRSGYLNHP
jgi:hypothetical protein